MTIEGVTYHRYRVRFRLIDGRRRLWYRWSPGEPWVFSEIARELEERGIYPEHLKGGGFSVEDAT